MAHTAYFDESGTHGDASVFALACVVGTSDEWEQFEQEWNVLLGRFGVSYSHMKEMESFKKAFAGWTPSDKVAFMQDATAILNARHLGRITCSIDMNDYRELVRGRVEKFIGSKYLIAFGFCMHLVAEWVRRSAKENEVDFVFEVNDFSGQITDIYTTLRKHPAVKTYLRVGNIAFKGKDECVPLQASDIIAYESYKGYTNLLAGQPRKRRKSLVALAQGGDWWGYHVDKLVLQLYVDRAENFYAGRKQPDIYSMLGLEDERP
jgi:hypothetical protein